MQDECLLQIYAFLIPEAKKCFDTLASIIKSGSMEQIMQVGQLSTQQVRKGIAGLRSTGLIKYRRGLPISLSKSGIRLAELLKR